MLDVRPKTSVSMHTRDGVRLDADVYYPVAPGDYPVLLMRQPYGRAIASTVVYAHPAWYAAHGYIVVIQDVRGRGTSEGRFSLFAHEVEDGYDTVTWAAQLPGSTGAVGMYGFSYQGMTQLYAAQAQPSALKTIAPAMVGYDLYHDWAYENGALRLQAGLGWAIQLAAETSRRAQDEPTFQTLYAASRQLPLHGPHPANPDLLRTCAPDSFFHQWLAHPQHDAYWQALKPQLDSVDLPMLHVGGWFDPYLTGDLRLFHELSHRSQCRQQLWIGPWPHLPWSRKVGEIDFGPQALNPIDHLQIQWFDTFLKHKSTSLLETAPIHLFEMLTNHWLTFDQWPHPTPMHYHLASTGLAAMREDNGHLIPSQLAERSRSQHNQNPTPNRRLSGAEAEAETDILIHDPWRPVPSLGGHAGIPAGSFERAAIDGRSDVLTYTSSPLEQDLHVVGEIVVELLCQSDAVSYDLCAIVSVVYPDGKVYNLTQGYCRLDQPRDVVSLVLQPTCFCIQAGQAIRLSLSAACFPAYAMNSGTGESPQVARLIDSQVITVMVKTGEGSRLRLPVVNRPTSITMCFPKPTSALPVVLPRNL
jgi:uncharacterized protein